jgi:CRISPR-associated protein Cmr2
MSDELLHFSLGPVQQFVGQSRRTRDLWASSFLLSYLVGVGIEAICENDDKADFRLPVIEDDDRDPTNDLIAALREEADGEDPRFGSLPNRFQVHCADPETAAEEAEKAILAKWKEIAQSVWERCLDGPASAGNRTRDIWENQIEDFWSIYWAVGEDSALLDQRKNWRHRFPRPQHGDKCTMMHRWQELSGWCGNGRNNNRDKQQQFWEAVRSEADVGGLDLKENERLCAVAFIKRMFPKCASNAIGWDLDVTHWPSTAYLAAVPWLEHIGRNAPNRAADYADSVLSAQHSAKGEWHTELPGLQAAATEADVGDFYDQIGRASRRERVYSGV